MLRLNHTPNQLLAAIAVIWLAAVGAIFLVPSRVDPPEETPAMAAPPQEAPPSEPVVVTHWVSSHLMRAGLLKNMADRFNQSVHRTKSGRPMVVEVHDVPPSLQAEFLTALLGDGIRIPLHERTEVPIAPDIPNPTIVTPSSSHWFVQVNHEVGRNVVDLASARSIVRPFVGIVTYQDMAICLGWPEKELGYADIIALRADDQGWAKYDCAKAEWGSRPLVAYTDPTTSSTGRSLLLGLYSIAADKPPEKLTLEDVNEPQVVAYIKKFQDLIDHYSIGTTVLNTKIHQGPRYGHFFIMPEDNLIHLYEGTEEAYIGGKKVTAPPITPGSMVMIYPEEGAMPRNNCACVVQADWVTDEHKEASQQWIDFLLEDAQQRSFMEAGFRPGGDLPLTDPSSKINAKYGLDPEQPTLVIDPSLMDPAVAAVIDQSWQDVKKQGIITLVLDISSSMMGAKLQQAADGVIRFLDKTPRNNQVGLVNFNDTITARIEVAPSDENRLKIADAVRQAQAQGESALYHAIKVGIQMTDEAQGEEEAIRGVVVLTDGKNTSGNTLLHDLIVMRLGSECRVVEEWNEEVGYELVEQCADNPVDKNKVTGIRLSMETRHDIQIFFIGIGEDADLQVCRMLTEASGAECRGTTEEDLAAVIEAFSGYF